MELEPEHINITLPLPDLIRDKDKKSFNLLILQILIQTSHYLWLLAAGATTD
jgi:hypothetical protein